MIQLTSETLATASLAHLSAIQSLINAESTFKDRVGKANSQWKGKQSTTAAKTAFSEIKNKLKEMCSGAEICVYCEHNESTDIEHIFPKRLYPGKCFSWENYVLACGKCNTHFKKDSFKIFNPSNSESVENISPQRNSYLEPANEDNLFVNQRSDDPMDYLELDFLGRTFYYMERPAAGTRQFEKAKFTKDILGLNSRDDLVHHRKAAYRHYKGELERYISIGLAAGMTELTAATDSLLDTFDPNGEFDIEKARVLDGIKKRITTHSHPTIWKEMIRQRDDLPEINQLFNTVPDAVGW